MALPVQQSPHEVISEVKSALYASYLSAVEYPALRYLDNLLYHFPLPQVFSDTYRGYYLLRTVGISSEQRIDELVGESPELFTGIDAKSIERCVITAADDLCCAITFSPQVYRADAIHDRLLTHHLPEPSGLYRKTTLDAFGRDYLSVRRLMREVIVNLRPLSFMPCRRDFNTTVHRQEMKCCFDELFSRQSSYRLETLPPLGVN